MTLGPTDGFRAGVDELPDDGEMSPAIWGDPSPTGTVSPWFAAASSP